MIAGYFLTIECLKTKFSGVAILSNAPEPRKSDPSKKAKKPEPETTIAKKPSAVAAKGVRPGKQRLNGTSADEVAKAPTPASRQQVKSLDLLLWKMLASVDAYSLIYHFNVPNYVHL